MLATPISTKAVAIHVCFFAHMLSDRERVPTILCSSREARRLYSQMGFRSVQTWTIDNGYWAREIEKHEPELSGNDQFRAATFEGCSEEEIYMVRDTPVN